MPSFKSRARAGRRTSSTTAWIDSTWYTNMVGSHGHAYHRHLALPTILDLLELKSGNSVLDIGCGTGVLAPQLRHFGLFYTGLDASPQMLAHARRFHGSKDFILGNACHLPQRIKRRQYNAITFMFSLQDMHPLNDILFEAASVLQPNGTIIAVLTHPCFRIPRQSGWGYDKARKLHYRRIDRYLTPFSTRSGTGKTVTFHRPLQAYIEALYTAGFYIDQLRELAPTKALLKDLGHKHKKRPHNFDLPSLLAFRARQFVR